MTISNAVSVLIIEDEEAVYNLIKAVLKDKPAGWPLRYRLTHGPTLNAATKILGLTHCDIILLDLNLSDSSGLATFWAIQAITDAPIIVFTGSNPNGVFDQVIKDGAYRCYAKTDLAKCMHILHYTIRHVLLEYNDKRIIRQQSETIAGKLTPTILECAGCRRWYDEPLARWVSQTYYLKQRNFIISHGHCPDCHDDYYGKDLRDATKDFE